MLKRAWRVPIEFHKDLLGSFWQQCNWDLIWTLDSETNCLSKNFSKKPLRVQKNLQNPLKSHQKMASRFLWAFRRQFFVQIGSGSEILHWVTANKFNSGFATLKLTQTGGEGTTMTTHSPQHWFGIKTDRASRRIKEAVSPSVCVSGGGGGIGTL